MQKSKQKDNKKNKPSATKAKPSKSKYDVVIQSDLDFEQVMRNIADNANKFAQLNKRNKSK